VDLEFLFGHLFVRFVSFKRKMLTNFRTLGLREARTGRMIGGNAVVGLLCQFILKLETFIVSIAVPFILKVVHYSRLYFLLFILAF